MSTILITGANRGIGLALAKTFVARGDHVIAACRHSSDALDALGAQVETGVDVATDEGIRTLPERVGDRRIDVLVLNAGVLGEDALGRLDDDAVASICRQFEVNSLAPLRVVDALLPRLAADARVAIITSRMGSMADNGSGGYYGYRMSKAAVNAAGKSLAIDLKPRGIAVALLHPGFVSTDMVGGRGDVSPDAAAAALVERIDELNLGDTGCFRHANGQSLEW